MTCSFIGARKALARVLGGGLGMQVDIDRDEAKVVEGVPLVVLRTGTPELQEEIIHSPRLFAYLDRVNVAITLQADFQGDREAALGRLAGRVEEVIAGNRTLDGTVDFADCEAFERDTPSILGITDIADVTVPVTLEYCTLKRSGGD